MAGIEDVYYSKATFQIGERNECLSYIGVDPTAPAPSIGIPMQLPGPPPVERSLCGTLIARDNHEVLRLDEKYRAELGEETRLNNVAGLPLRIYLGEKVCIKGLYAGQVLETKSLDPYVP